ncbi:MAG: twin-arginine translocase TatA/TatE family subunit [Bacillota bacterium]|nr:twin-arginine translocase TatA/TatE family subunit [Bacillota bacterium]
MGKIGFGELLIVLAIVLIVFGPKKLPELAKGMGEAVREFRKGQKDLEDSLNQGEISKEEKTDGHLGEQIDQAQNKDK